MTWFFVPLLVLASVTAGPTTPPAVWRWPVAPPHLVLCGFHPPVLRWLPGRRGVDLLTWRAAEVVAAGPGVVTFAGRVGGDGVVVVRHRDGAETTYEPVVPAVRVGAAVGAGAHIGTLAAGSARSPTAVCRGPDGARCPPGRCLHWGLRRGERYLDPLGLLGPVRVRLLPHLGGSGPPVPPALPTVTTLGGGAVCVGLWRWRRQKRRFGCE